MALGVLKIRLRSEILGISEFANLNRGKVHLLGETTGGTMFGYPEGSAS